MRQMIEKGLRFPEAAPRPFFFGQWPARWISIEGADAPNFVAAYRLRFHVETTQVARVHVTADQRYELWLDGQRIGRGPERGDRMNWFYETYDLHLTPGEHLLVARVWSLDTHGFLAPTAQVSLRHGLLLAAEGPLQKTLSTGLAPWQGKRLDGYSFAHSPLPGAGAFAGGVITVDGRKFPWNWHLGEGDGWADAIPGRVAYDRWNAWGEISSNHRLRPASLPPMMEQPRRVGRVVAINKPVDANVEPIPYDAVPSTETPAWQQMLDGKAPVTVPPQSIRRVLIDLDDYYCAYPRITLSGGRDAVVKVNWAESLYSFPADTPGEQPIEKGNRAQWAGKYFRGRGDTFIADGSEGRTFDTLWWQCGRWVEIVVQTADQPLTINTLEFHETRYPLQMDGRVELDDPRFNAVVPIMWRTLQMCAHETYMDCPHYEQLMYTGDTRLEALVTCLMTTDDRLPRKAITMFAQSCTSDGLTQSRYPASSEQVIPQFSLYFVAMLYDYALWRGDRKFVLEHMPRARSVLEVFIGRIDDRGLVQWPEGWNWIDWVPEWDNGDPLHNPLEPNAINQWQFVYVLGLAAELERYAGENELADRLERIRRRVADRIIEHYWDESRGLFADSLKKDRFSEHAQCFALLSGVLDADRQARVIDGLLKAPDLARATIYFQHYLFEVYRLARRIDAMLDRMQLWFDLPAMGLKTCLEKPEPSRSDCHAWGAHPLYHACASILGIRPAALGAEQVVFEPSLGPLQRAHGEFFIGKGRIVADLERVDGSLRGYIDLPHRMTGEFRHEGQSLPLQPGRNQIKV